MATAKEVFKRNFMEVARSQGITSGTALSRITYELAESGKIEKGVEKTHCNSMLKEAHEPINLTLEKVEAFSVALGVPCHDLLNPSFNYGVKNGTQFDIETLSDSLRMVRSIAEREGIENIEFESRLASFMYFAKQNDLSEADRYAEVARVTREYLK